MANGFEKFKIKDNFSPQDLKTRVIEYYEKRGQILNKFGYGYKSPELQKLREEFYCHYLVSGMEEILDTRDKNKIDELLGVKASKDRAGAIIEIIEQNRNKYELAKRSKIFRTRYELDKVGDQSMYELLLFYFKHRVKSQKPQIEAFIALNRLVEDGINVDYMDSEERMVIENGQIKFFNVQGKLVQKGIILIKAPEKTPKKQPKPKKEKVKREKPVEKIEKKEEMPKELASTLKDLEKKYSLKNIEITYDPKTKRLDYKADATFGLPSSIPIALTSFDSLNDLAKLEGNLSYIKNIAISKLPNILSSLPHIKLLPEGSFLSEKPSEAVIDLKFKIIDYTYIFKYSLKRRNFSPLVVFEKDKIYIEEEKNVKLRENIYDAANERELASRLEIIKTIATNMVSEEKEKVYQRDLRKFANIKLLNQFEANFPKKLLPIIPIERKTLNRLRLSEINPDKTPLINIYFHTEDNNITFVSFSKKGKKIFYRACDISTKEGKEKFKRNYLFLKRLFLKELVESQKLHILQKTMADPFLSQLLSDNCKKNYNENLKKFNDFLQKIDGKEDIYFEIFNFALPETLEFEYNSKKISIEIFSKNDKGEALSFVPKTSAQIANEILKKLGEEICIKLKRSYEKSDLFSLSQGEMAKIFGAQQLSFYKDKNLNWEKITFALNKKIPSLEILKIDSGKKLVAASEEAMINYLKTNKNFFEKTEKKRTLETIWLGAFNNACADILKNDRDTALPHLLQFFKANFAKNTGTIEIISNGKKIKTFIFPLTTKEVDGKGSEKEINKEEIDIQDEIHGSIRRFYFDDLIDTALISLNEAFKKTGKTLPDKIERFLDGERKNIYIKINNIKIYLLKEQRGSSIPESKSERDFALLDIPQFSKPI